MTRASTMILILAAGGCGSSVVVPGGEGGSGASSSSSGSEPCMHCRNVLGSTFSADRLCPGEERAKYEALIACACQENTCAVLSECLEPSGAFLLLCDGGYIGGGCATCVGEHCWDEEQVCQGEEPP